MKLTRLDGDGTIGCYGGNCPAVFSTDKGTIVVQGDILTAEVLEQLKLPKGETAVEVPREVFEGVF